MSYIPPNPIHRVEVVMADGTRLVAEGAMDGTTAVDNEYERGGVDHGWVTRAALRSTLTVTVSVDRASGDTLTWLSAIPKAQAPETDLGTLVTRKWLAEVISHGIIACTCRHGRGGNRLNTNPECPRHGWEVREVKP